MSKIDELIKEKCPNGIRHLTLGETCNIKTGAGITKKDASKDGIYPIISGGIEPLGMYSKSNRKANTITIARAGSAGYVNYVDKDFYLNDKCFSIIPNRDYSSTIDNRFLYFVLKNKEKDIMGMKSTGSVPTVNTQKISKIRIPVPPIEVQREIVEILNSFTELEAELEAELIKRKQQYEHYRDHLLSFENITSRGGQVEWLPLKELCKVSRGKRVVRSQLSKNKKDGFPVYQNSLKPLGYFNKYNCEAKKVFVICAGAAGEIGYSEVNFWAADDCSYFTCDSKISERYLYHVLMNNYNYLSSKVRRSSIPRLSKELIENIKVPVPTKDIQERIVYVLDNFDAVCHDLNIGLPAEIKARQKQYEYYRDRLLSFDAVVSGTEGGVAKLRQYIFGFVEIQLKLVTSYSKERIASNNLNKETFVGVDNLLQGKLGKTASEHLPENGNLTKYTPGDILIGNIRPYLRKIWFANNIGGASGDVLVIKNDFDQLDSRYLYHVLASESFFEYNNGKSKGSKMPRGDKTAIMAYSFVIPTIDIQQKTIAILDKFDKLTCNMAAGLPAEIKARQKQYEYFRNKLLTFKAA